MEQHQRSLDENGLRYFLNAVYQIKLDISVSLAAKDFAWALFSESQDYLLGCLTQSLGGAVFWKDAKSLGYGYWISSPNTLVFSLIVRHLTPCLETIF